MKNRTLQHRDQLITYGIHHKKAVTRRIHLRAAPDGTLMVIAPPHMSQRAIHKTLQERVHKVAHFLVGALERLQETPDYRYVNGESHLYLGQWLQLEMGKTTRRSAAINFSDGKIQVFTADGSPQQVESKLSAWYRKQAAEHFTARMGIIAKNAPWTGGKAPEIRLRKMKRTWGSCSATGRITLNPRLIRAPQACIDYVIAHELCHLKEMNHGKAFYALQEQLFPAWRAAREHLHSQAHVYLHE
jgi:predicted metal-dependent hydrolase